MMNQTEAKKYKEGLEELLFINPTFGTLARAMGMPIWDTEQPTAYVTFDDKENKIRFAFNPEFINELSTEEVAAVIAHETHHVVLDHLNELQSDDYENKNALIKAQECIINDTIDTVFELPLIEGVLRGPELINTDCTPLSTMAAYQLFVEQEECNKDTDSSSSSDDNNSESNEGRNTESDNDSIVDSACSGVRIEEKDQENAAKSIKKIFTETAEELEITFDDFIESIENTSDSSYSPGGNPKALEAAKITQERMNWNYLLAKINPKVLQAGKKRQKIRNDWVRPNRRYGAISSKVILPVQKPVVPKNSTKGDELPVFVIALDLSGSIPRELVNTLQGLLSEIPENLIKAYPCTWADNCIPFEDGKVVRSGGTNINSVIRYVEQVKKDSNVDPYVLVITDGEYKKQERLPGKKWFYMAVNDSSVKTIKGDGFFGYGGHVSSSEEVYHIKDFKVRA